MPAYFAHNYFGEDVLVQMPDIAPNQSLRTRQAFLLGCQGPDPLFYASISPWIRHHRHFGSTLHSRNVAETLNAFRLICTTVRDANNGTQTAVLWAYILGFICHYSLDSTAHPFVYAQQYAICAAGVPGLDERDGSAVHIQMESDLDMMILTQRRGQDIDEYNYSLGVLGLDDDGLAALDGLYEQMAKQVYGIDLDAAQFSTGVKNMRLAMRVLYSPRGIKRAALGYVERIFRRHSTLQALSYRAGVGTSCHFDNCERSEWTNPFTDQVSHESFAELYDKALRLAHKSIKAYCDNKSATSITKGINFNGDNEAEPKKDDNKVKYRQQMNNINAELKTR